MSRSCNLAILKFLKKRHFVSLCHDFMQFQVRPCVWGITIFWPWKANSQGWGHLPYELICKSAWFPIKSSIFSYVWIGMHVHAKSLWVALGFANAQSPGGKKVANAPSLGLTRQVNVLPVPGGAWAYLELTDALISCLDHRAYNWETGGL